MKISQSFHSIQGEGISSGVDAYFIRFTGCNLSCGTSLKSLQALSKHLKDNPDESGSAELDREYGDLLKEGKATWVCDTTSVWLKGKEVSNEELEERFFQAGVLGSILAGITHLVWTGGEPLIHQESIKSFLNYLLKKYPSKVPYSEIETNGTLYAEQSFYNNFIQQINCSPKLANSGMEKDERINPKAIKQINYHHNSWFKFVINKEEDIKEIRDCFQFPFGIIEKQIILMPGADNRDDLIEASRFVAEMTKKYGYRCCTRLQVALWNKVTGV